MSLGLEGGCGGGRYASLLILTSGAGAVANLILSVVKIAGGRVYHSKALFADGIHSFSDLVSDIGACALKGVGSSFVRVGGGRLPFGRHSTGGRAHGYQ